MAGVPEAGGQGNVTLDVSVVEKSTGYEEKSTELVTVAAAPVNIRLIPEGSAFKPGLPFGFLVVTETPDGQPVEAEVALETTFFDENYNEVGRDSRRVETSRGTAQLRILAPTKAVRMLVQATSGPAGAYQEITAAYSPSGNFVYVEQQGEPALSVGDTAKFHVVSTSEATTFYYEVVSRDRVIFSGSGGPDISIRVTPAMAPSARLLVYQILPSSEVAADSLPFEVTGDYPQQVGASFSSAEVRPGDEVTLNLQTEGRAKVGIAAVDRSVFILAENRLNLQQVFAELERLYMQPQAELHEAQPMVDPLLIPGARDTFQDAGLLVLTDKRVPEGKKLEQPGMMAGGVFAFGDGEARDAFAPQQRVMKEMGVPAQTPLAPAAGLAEVQRVRQFFPETWIWEEVDHRRRRQGLTHLHRPRLHHHLGSARRRPLAGERPGHRRDVAEGLPAVLPAGRPALLGDPGRGVPGEGRPLQLPGHAADPHRRDRVRRLVRPARRGREDRDRGRQRHRRGGVQDPARDRGVATGEDHGAQHGGGRRRGQEPDRRARGCRPGGGGERGPVARRVANGRPAAAGRVVPDSARAYVALTGSYLTQTIDGLDQLLQMPFGCGEQNMILFAPDVFILDYLKETGQLKPEIMAKAEILMITGYQRELTYRRDDGSFSAFGRATRRAASGLPPSCSRPSPRRRVSSTSTTPSWPRQPPGSPAPEARRLLRAGRVRPPPGADGRGCGQDGSDRLRGRRAPRGRRDGGRRKALGYLEGRLDAIDDPYTLALTTYALELGKSAGRRRGP